MILPLSKASHGRWGYCAYLASLEQESNGFCFAYQADGPNAGPHNQGGLHDCHEGSVESC